MLRCQSDKQHVFNRCTRSSITDIILPKFHLDVAKKSFYYHGACIFNSLPTIDIDIISLVASLGLPRHDIFMNIYKDFAT